MTAALLELRSTPPIVNYYRKLLKEESAIRNIVLLFLGAGVNLTVALTFIVSIISSVPASTSPHPTTTTTFILAVSYFIMGIFYSTVVSLMFKPKRIVSPLYAQIITASFIPIVVAASLLMSFSGVDLISFSGTLFADFVFALFIFGAAGFGQLIVVRSLVGLNGTKDDILSDGLKMKAKLSEVVKVLRKDDLQYATDIVWEKRLKKDVLLFHSRNGADAPIFVVAASDPDDQSETLLGVVSYEQDYLGISKDRMGKRHDGRMEEIKKGLLEAGITPLDEPEVSRAERIAQAVALRPTESKLMTLRSWPPYRKAILVGIVSMVLLMTGLEHYNYVSLELYETFWIFAGFSLLFDFLPSFERKKQRLD